MPAIPGGFSFVVLIISEGFALIRADRVFLGKVFDLFAQPQKFQGRSQKINRSDEGFIRKAGRSFLQQAADNLPYAVMIPAAINADVAGRIFAE